MDLLSWEKGPQRSHRRSHSRRHIQPRDAEDYGRAATASITSSPTQAGYLRHSLQRGKSGRCGPAVNGRRRHGPDAEGRHGRRYENNPECRPVLRTMYLGQQPKIARARGVSAEVIAIFREAMGDVRPGRAESKRPRPWWAATSLSCCMHLGHVSGAGARVPGS